MAGSNATRTRQFITGNPLDLGAAVYNMLTCPVTLVGNFLLVLVLYKDPFRCFRTPQSYLLVVMAAANVITGFLTQPLVVASHLMLYLGKGLDVYQLIVRKLVASVSLLSLNISFFLLLALAVDNYIAVSRPLKYRVLVTVRKAKLWIVFSVVYALIFALLPYATLPDKVVFHIDLHVNSTINSLILLGTYVLLYKSFGTKLIKSVQLRGEDPKGAIQDANMLRIQIMKKKFQKLLFIFVIVFTVPALISTINWYVIFYCTECFRKFPAQFRFSGLVLANLIFLKPAADPFVFAWRIPKYRQALRKCCTCTRATPGPQKMEEKTVSVILLSVRSLDDHFKSDRQQDQQTSL